LGAECLGSIEYAVNHLATIELLVVLGHSYCGAVTAAVDVYLDPSEYPNVASTQGLRSIVDRLFVSVRGAALVLEATAGKSVRDASGYRRALIETAAILNAALTAMILRRDLGEPVAFGVHDVVSRRVRVPRVGHDGDFALCDPPEDLGELRRLGLAIAESTFVKSILEPAS
ncbi:MAG: carbonic anhydrase, partial [Acidobacteriota bacterium]|nr:carbonic anhydrase [Acidobacteriota bacterium]